MSAFALLLLMMFQTAAIGPRSGADPIGAGCPVSIRGNLVFPPYAQKRHFVTLTLVADYSPYLAGQETTTTVYDQFSFAANMGSYTLMAELPGMDAVRQTIRLGLGDCGTIIYVEVPLHISPAIKPSPLEEDVVSIETLMRKTSDYETNLQRGLDFRKEDRREDSINALNRALDLNSASMRARAALGQYSLEKGDFEKAAELLSEAVRLGSMSGEVYYMLGSAYYKLHRADVAEASLIRALSLTPENAKIHLQLYNVYMAKSQRAEALKQLETYLEKSPNAADKDYVRSMADKLRQTLKP